MYSTTIPTNGNDDDSDAQALSRPRLCNDSESPIELEEETKEDDHQIRQITFDWIQRVVIGLSFCPFAEKPWRDQQIHVDIVHGNDETHILQQVLQRMLHHKTQPGTTLVVCPECHPDNFAAYLQVLSVVDDELIPEYELQGHVQVASFHPLYQFGGSGEDDIDNWTNRAPYPMFHILREADVTKAVDKLGGHEHATKVWQRNIDLLELLQDEVGAQNVARYIQPSCNVRGNDEMGNAINMDEEQQQPQQQNEMLTDECLHQRVKEILQRHRFQMASDNNNLPLE